MKDKLIICVAAIGIFIVYTLGVYGKGTKDERQDWQTKWNEQVAMHEKAIASAKAAEQEKEIQWLKEFDKVRNDAQVTINRINTDLASSNESADRLRNQVARLAARASKDCTNTGYSQGSNTAGAAINMLADMSTGFDEAAREISGFADKSRSAGLACQRVYGVIKNQR